ncbi:MAG: phage integrase SAM-like domain-containing protein, partial [Muribaculaceae bacterium]|nr:phage integrase SAM-like domain-containing protein [Muribaculaceae bacterium]
MPDEILSVMPVISLDDIRCRLVGAKSPGTIRYYSAMLNHLETYNGSEQLDLAKITPQFVSGFGDHLFTSGLSLSTINLFKMAFRAVMKEAFGPELKTQFKAAFKNVGSRNNATTNCITCRDIRKLTGHSLNGFPVLDKTRSLFIYCLISGGIDFTTLQSMCGTNSLHPEIPHQEFIISEFQTRHNRPFSAFVAKLTAENYRHNLMQLGHTCGLSQPLHPGSALDGWIAVAREIGLSPEEIASVVHDAAEIAAHSGVHADITHEKRLKTLEQTADSIIDIKTRWHVMRCHDITPAEITHAINQQALPVSSHITTFTIPTEFTKGSKLMESMLFFNSSASDAIRIRTFLGSKAHIYQFAGSDIPAHISDNEMKTLMILCDLPDTTLSCYFPDRSPLPPDIAIGSQARIIHGSLSGYVGVINAVSPGRYRVSLTFPSLGTARVLATRPRQFRRLWHTF